MAGKTTFILSVFPANIYYKLFYLNKLEYSLNNAA